MKKYLEIVGEKSNKVFKRFDVTGFNKNQIETLVKEKTKKLASTRFYRIIDSVEELESDKVKLPKS